MKRLTRGDGKPLRILATLPDIHRHPLPVAQYADSMLIEITSFIIHTMYILSAWTNDKSRRLSINSDHAGPGFNSKVGTKFQAGPHASSVK